MATATIGYAAMLEQFGPAEVLDLCARAEAAGFSGVMAADHFQPWIPRQGQAAFVWEVLAVAGNFETASVLFNNGDGSFGTKQDYPTGHGSYAIAATDLDGDGTVDLAISNELGSSVCVLQGAGDGTFANGVGYGTGEMPRGFCLGDFNRDGKPDLAVAEAAANAIALLLNVTPDPAGMADGPPIPRPIALAAAPNPARSIARITFELAAPALATLEILDVSGRLTCVLANQKPMTAGRHELIWDTCDAAGRRAPRGVYLARLRAGDREETGKILILP
jgi:hypothetical protein